MVRESRRERERRRHRTEILEAATKLVADHGPEAVTVEKVAKEADFAVGSIYRHFPSKEALFEEVMLGLLGALSDAVERELAAGGAFEGLLERVVRVTYRAHVDQRTVLLAFLELPGPLPSAESGAGQGYLAFKTRWRALTDDLLARGQAEGVLAAGDRASRIVALHALIVGFARAAMFGATLADPPGAIVRMFLGGAAGPGWADRPAVVSET